MSIRRQLCNKSYWLHLLQLLTLNSPEFLAPASTIIQYGSGLLAFNREFQVTEAEGKRLFKQLPGTSFSKVWCTFNVSLTTPTSQPHLYTLLQCNWQCQGHFRCSSDLHPLVTDCHRDDVGDVYSPGYRLTRMTTLTKHRPLQRTGKCITNVQCGWVFIRTSQTFCEYWCLRVLLYR